MKMNKMISVIVSCVFLLSTACANRVVGAQDNLQSIQDKINQIVTYDQEDLKTAWDQASATLVDLATQSTDKDGATFSDGNLTISQAGDYVLSGTLSDGQIIVNTEDKDAVHIILDGVQVAAKHSAALYIKNSEKVILTLADGSQNTLEDAGSYIYTDTEKSEPDAALFSKADLTINGNGSLSVLSESENGIKSKDSLKIVSGTIAVTAQKNGISGKDLLAVQSASITVNAKQDAMKSTNNEDAARGQVVIEGGTFTIAAQNDGIQAETALYITGGSFTITTAGGSAANTEHQTSSDDVMGRQNFDPNRERPPMDTAKQAPPPVQAQAQTQSTEEAEATASESAKALKSGTDFYITDGAFAIDAYDDALHSNTALSIYGGTYRIATGDDAIHAENALSIYDGNIKISASYEGLEGETVTIKDGYVFLTSSDDGINAAGGETQATAEAQTNTRPNLQSNSNNLISIEGGTTVIHANGDGIDSNKDAIMTNGLLIVNGPVSGQNSALDYDGSFQIDGGTLIAAGSSRMMQTFSEQSSQASIAFLYSSAQTADNAFRIEDSSGKEIITYALSKEYQSIIVSSPEITDSDTYRIYYSGSAKGEQADNLYQNAIYTQSAEPVSITTSQTVTYVNESGVTEHSLNARQMGKHMGGERP